MPSITLTINSKSVTADIESRTLLVDLIREQLKLTGTHIGCDTSQCGACVVLVGDKSIKSCSMLALEADGAEVTTIEGMAQNGELHPMQQAFHEEHGLQCGFCTPGVVISASELLRKNKSPEEGEIRHWLEGNICRCTGYHNIVKAVQSCSEKMRGG